MCDICQMQFGWEHEATAQDNIPCPRCRRFYVSPEQETCYHCWTQESGLEGCEQCAADGAPEPINTH